MSETITYKRAVKRASQIVGKIEGLGIFNVSSMLAWTFNKDKQVVIDDILKERMKLIGDKRKTKRLM